MSTPALRLAGVAVLLLLAAAPAAATDIVGTEDGTLYRVTVIVTGREETRQAPLPSAGRTAISPNLRGSPG